MASGDNRKSSVDLEEILNLPAQEFHSQLLSWIKGDVSKSLQTKLRELMAELFNETMLGKTIQSRSKQNQALVLSPLVLSLNTIVAEFLYAQNCHFTLSTFASEVPFQNTLPDFASHPQYKFDESDLYEVYKAININQTQGEEVRQMYYSTDSRKSNHSLLHCLFTVLLKTNGSDQIKRKPTASTKKTTKNFMAACNCADEFNKLNCSSMQHLNKYLDACAGRITQMSTELNRLKSSQTDVRATATQLEQLNHSFEELKSKSSVSNKKTSILVNGIEKLTVKLEACAINFGQLADTMKMNANKSISKTYVDFLKELKDSPHGQKFIRKVEKSITATLYEEKMKMETALKEERMQMKTKYKQRLMAKIESQLQQHFNDKTKRDDRILEEIKSLEHKFEQNTRDEPNRAKLKQTDGNINSTSDVIKNQMTPATTPQTITSISTEQDGPTNHGAPQPKATALKQSLPLSSHTAFVISIDPTPSAENVVKIVPKQLLTVAGEPSPESPPQPPSPPHNNQPQLNLPRPVIAAKTAVIDTVVHVAKKRLSDLELESERLERQFSQYLNRQEEQKLQFNSDVSKIWENYSKDCVTLNKSIVTANTGVGMFLPPNPVVIQEPHQKEINIDLRGIHEEDAIQFENPFKDFNAEKFAKSRLQPSKSDRTVQVESRKLLKDKVHTSETHLKELKRITRTLDLPQQETKDKRLDFDLTFNVDNKSGLNLKEKFVDAANISRYVDDIQKLSENSDTSSADEMKLRKSGGKIKSVEVGRKLEFGSPSKEIENADNKVKSENENLLRNAQIKKGVKFKDQITETEGDFNNKDLTKALFKIEETKSERKSSVGPNLTQIETKTEENLLLTKKSSEKLPSMSQSVEVMTPKALPRISKPEAIAPTPSTSGMDFKLDISRSYTISSQPKQNDPPQQIMSSDSSELQMKMSTGQRTSSDESSWN